MATRSKSNQKKQKKTPVTGVVVKTETKPRGKKQKQQEAAVKPGAKPVSLPIGRLHHTTNAYGKKDSDLTMHAQAGNNIYLAVETGRVTTPKALAALFPRAERGVARRIGYAIHDGRWSINGVAPLYTGKRDRAKDTKLGLDVLANHSGKTITVISAYKRKSAL